MQFGCGGSEMHAFTAGVRADADNLFVVTDEPSHVDVWRGIAFSTPFSAALLLPGTPHLIRERTVGICQDSPIDCSE
jgi:hypothetical protein